VFFSSSSSSVLSAFDDRNDPFLVAWAGPAWTRLDVRMWASLITRELEKPFDRRK
jgi:hypothetical protein